MRIASVGHAIFAVTMIALGTMGLIQGVFVPVWAPVPKGVPAREALVYLCAFISLASGIGLLWRRTATLAARVLLVWFLFWLLAFRLHDVFPSPMVLASWYGCAETAVMVAGAWVLYAWFASDWERQRLGFATGSNGVRIARVLYGLSLVFFGLGHFAYLKETVADVPGWLPWPAAWAYFTGCAFVAGGLAVLIGVYARLAAALSTIEIGMLLLLVWVPIVAAGSATPFQWSETIVSWAIMAGAWVVADSYRAAPSF